VANEIAVVVIPGEPTGPHTVITRATPAVDDGSDGTSTGGIWWTLRTAVTPANASAQACIPSDSAIA
jgi:hypothetical protein